MYDSILLNPRIRTLLLNGTNTKYTALRNVTTLSTNCKGLTLNSMYNYRVRVYRRVGTARI